MAEPQADALSLEEVQHLAKLARLTLGPEEATHLLTDVRRILGYVAKLTALTIPAAAPQASALPPPSKLRDDVVLPGLPLDRALHNAPEPLGTGFGVPKIIE